jgi:periplasmic protein TonB
LSRLAEIKNKGGWGYALIFSVFLNAGMFSLMPGLISKAPEVPRMPVSVEAVNFIRIRTAAESAPGKFPEKEKIVEKKTETLIQKAFISQKITQKLAFPFEVNPRLPETAGNIPTLLMEKYAIGGRESRGPDGVDAYGTDEIDHPITPLVRVPPIYPMRARRMGIEGFVKVKMLVTQEGNVERTEILDSQPRGVFEKSVLQCTASWRFSPGTLDGTPVKTFVTTTIRFSLENE